MKLAVLLHGISLNPYYIDEGSKYNIDYKNSYENYKQFIFEFFSNKGYNIDVYFTTNILDDKNKKEICEKYKPIRTNYIEDIKSNTTNYHILNNNNKLYDVINLCLESEFTYDLILITRFDLLFKKEFEKSNIQLDKFNLVSILEQNDYVCNNFYLFPYKYLRVFSNIITNNLNKNLKFVQQELYDNVNIGSINYILNENTDINNLSFYKIVRNPSVIETIYNLEWRGDKYITHWFVFMIAGLMDIFDGNPTEYLDDKKYGLNCPNVINWNVTNKNIKPKFPIKIHFTKGSNSQHNFVNDFQKQTFKILENEIIYIEDITSYKNENTQIINNYGAYLKDGLVDSKYIVFLRKLFLSKYNFEFKNRLVYISRKKAYGLIGSASEDIIRRHIINETELFDKLQDLGFEKCYLEDYEVENKIEIFNTARMIVAPHGGALVFSLFANESTKIVEIVPCNPTQFCDQYLRITKALDIEFHRFTNVRKDMNDNMYVNIDELIHVVKNLLV